jgi:hypothetical protein
MDGQLDDEPGAAAFCVLRGHLAAVPGDDTGDDRETEARSRNASLAALLRTPETPEQDVGVRRREAPAMVANS